MKAETLEAIDAIVDRAGLTDDRLDLHDVDAHISAALREPTELTVTLSYWVDIKDAALKISTAS